MNGPRIGELFAGYGGLGMGVQAVLGGEVAWFSEFDPAPSKILAHHWPTVPNHGDITKIDWSQVEPVDILTGGFPCQDVSLAGARAGFTATSRSGLWSEFARAIAALNPEMVLIENVRGLLSATAAGSVESDPWGVGDGATRPVINALGAVLGDLADLGYDAQWCGVRAADAGAPHGRFRVFIVAHRSGFGRGERWTESTWSEGRSATEFSGSVPADTESDEGRIGHGDDVSARWGTGRLGPDARASATEDADLATGDQRRLATSRQAEAGRARADSRGRSGASAADAESVRRPRCIEPRSNVVEDGPESAHSGSPWGTYEPAIRRWELALGRLAPMPTNPDGKNGAHRLSASFVEWMMGLPAGHVTAAGLTRNSQLKALGNGVVPQQAALALSSLLPRMEKAK